MKDRSDDPSHHERTHLPQFLFIKKPPKNPQQNTPPPQKKEKKEKKHKHTPNKQQPLTGIDLRLSAYQQDTYTTGLHYSYATK